MFWEPGRQPRIFLFHALTIRNPANLLNFIGLPLPGVWQTRGRVWEKKGVLNWIAGFGDLRYGLCISKWCVFL